MINKILNTDGGNPMNSRNLSRFQTILPALVLCALVLASCNLPSAIPTATPTTQVTTQPTDTPQLPLDTPTPEVPSATPTITETLTPGPTNVVFTPGTTAAVVQGTLAAGQVKSYIVSAMQSQPMILILESPHGGSTLGVSEPDGTLLLDPALKWNTWQWLLPRTEAYTIQVFGGTTAGDFTLTIKVAQLAQFASGSTSVTLNGTTVNGYVFSYAFYCTSGQTMSTSLNVPSTTAILDVFGLATGPLLSSSANATTWSGVLPSTQDYVVEVIPHNGQEVNYTLTVSCN
jgi:hypothetical protein